MKIVFFNRFFFPDNSATSQILSDLAFHLAASGHDVHVVTSRVTEVDRNSEIVRGVTIHRVATAPTGPNGLFKRALAYVAYFHGARGVARKLVRPGDIVVLKTDPPLLSVVVGPLAKKLGARVVIWLQDIFPETAHEYGVPGSGGPIGAMLQGIRDRSLAQADHVVAICERMAQRVRDLGCIGLDRLSVIHNWADSEIVPVDVANNAARRRWSL